MTLINSLKRNINHHHWLIKELKKLVRKYPNDMELGGAVRTFVHEVIIGDYK